jgi:chromate transporter
MAEVGDQALMKVLLEGFMLTLVLALWIGGLLALGGHSGLSAVPVGALYLWRGGEDVLVHEALFFTGAAFLTFGGAYSVLSYVADVVVNGYGWLTADEMVQGLAESTPGPLIMVTQYVGFIGAWNDPGPYSSLLYGTLGR